MRKRIGILVVAALAIAILAVVAVRFRSLGVARPRGDSSISMIYGLHDGAAIVLWSERCDGRPCSRLSKLDSNGREVWTQDIPGIMVFGPGRGVVIGQGVIVAKFTTLDALGGESHHSLVALDRGDGRVLWKRVLVPYRWSTIPQGSFIPVSARVPGTIVGDVLVQYAHSGTESLLLGIDIATGVTRWQQPIANEELAPWVVGGRVVAHGHNGTEIFDVSTGRHTHLATRGIGCVVDDRYVTAIDDNGELAIVAYRDGDPAAPSVITRLDASTRPRSLRSCGHYGDRAFVLVIEGEQDQVLLVDRSGMRRATIDVSRLVAMPVLDAYPELAPLSGSLTRFAPVLETTDVGARIVMLDVERGVRAWERVLEAVGVATLVHAGEHWIALGSHTIYTFDGTTGRLVAAVRAGQGLTFTPTQIANGRIWVHDLVRGVAALDIATLAPIVTRGLNVVDVTAAERARLQLP